MTSESVSLEDRLSQSARTGELLDVSDEIDREITATAIRTLLFGSAAEDIDPRGVRLQGAHITGQLDLTDVRAAVPLTLHQCEFDESIKATRAHLPHLDLSGSRFPHLDADDLVCEHDIRLQGVRCEWLSLVDANITGDLSLSGVELAAAGTPALDVAGSIVGGDLLLDRGFVANSDSDGGTLRLLGANITGQLNLRRAQLTATNGPALLADAFVVGNNVLLDKGFTARSDSELGTLRFPSAHITGQLSLQGAHLTATNGPALRVDRITVGGDALLNRGFIARSDSQQGTLRFRGASITGRLNLRGAELSATNGSAIYAEDILVENNLFLDNGFTTSSNSSDGTVRLVGGNITGQLSLQGAHLTATNGPALLADTLTVCEDLFLDEELTVRSDSQLGTLRISNARIIGDLFIEMDKVDSNGQDKLVLDLQSVQVSGDLIASLEGLTTAEDHPVQMDVNGLQYPFMPRGTTYDQWLRMLREHTVRYAAQPYQQLASVYRAAGHDWEAREILIAQQRDLRRRGELGGWFRRMLHRLSGAFIGYGHRPFRAVGYLGGLCAVTVGLVLLAGMLGLAVRAHPNTGPCSIAESIGLGIDTAVPLLKTGSGQRCEIATTTGWGQALYLGNYLLTILGWAFATLFVAGYTGLVRRNN